MRSCNAEGLGKLLTALAVAMIATVASFLGGCASVQEYSTVKTPLGRTLRASQGQVVLRVEKARDLPNVMGRADIFGEKVAAGHEGLRYMGMLDDKTLLLHLHEVSVQSSETTMSRRGIVGPGLAPVGAGLTQLGGTSRASERTHEIRHSLTDRRVFEHAGITVTIIDATPTQLTYRLSRIE